MADKLCKGVCQIWDNTNGTGWIFLDDDSGAATVCKDDLNGASLKKGDHVEFYIRDQNGTKKAIRVRKCKEKSENKTGILYFQKHFYDKKQMQNINNIFGMNTNKGPKMLFGDDYNEKFRSKHKNRQRLGGQSLVMGHWDRSYGFGIPTSFNNSKSMGFIHNDHNFKNLMKKLFKELKIHLVNGSDVIIPYPTEKDVTQRKHKYFKSGNGWFSNSGKQIIHHNIGTGISSLSFNQLEIIQQHIDELKPLSSEIKYVDKVWYSKNETNHYKSTKTEMNNDELSTSNHKSSHGLLIFQTDWYNKQQMQRIHNFYREQNAIEKAPKMLFGDNDSDKARPTYKNRQFFGGMAGVMGQYDQLFSYGIVTTFFQNKTPNNMQFQRLMDIQFKPLKNHILNGYDIVIPKPSENEIRKNKHRYFRYGKQVIFHNIGTGIASLPFDFLKYIQTKIDELKKIAKNVLTVNYYKCQSSFNKSNHSNQHINDEKKQNTLTHQNINSNNNTHTTGNWYCKQCARVMELNDELCSFCMKSKPTQNEVSDADIAKKLQQEFVNVNVGQLEQKNKNLQQQLNVSDKELKSMKMKYEKLETIKQNNNAKCEQLQKHNHDLQQELNDSKEILKNMKIRLDEFQRDESMKLTTVKQQNNDKCQRIQKRNQNLQQQYETSENKLKKMTSKYAKQYEISQVLETENEKLKSDKMKCEQQLNDKMQELQNINRKFKTLTEHSKMLESKNKTLNVEMKNNEKELNETKRELKTMKLQFEVQEQRKKMQTLKNENKALKMDKEQKTNEQEVNDNDIDCAYNNEDVDIQNNNKHVKNTKHDDEWIKDGFNVKQMNHTEDADGEFSC